MTVAINKWHFNIGLWPALAFLFGFGTLIFKLSDYALDYKTKQDMIFNYIVRQSHRDTIYDRAVDSLNVWHPEDMDSRKKVNTLWEAMNVPETEIGYFTERKLKNGRVILIRVQHTTK